MLTMYIVSTILCVLIDALCYSVFEINQPRFLDIIWNIALFMPFLNIALIAVVLVVMAVNYNTDGDIGLKARDNKWAKWLLNEE